MGFIGFVGRSFRTTPQNSSSLRSFLKLSVIFSSFASRKRYRTPSTSTRQGPEKGDCSARSCSRGGGHGDLRTQLPCLFLTETRSSCAVLQCHPGTSEVNRRRGENLQSVAKCHPYKSSCLGLETLEVLQDQDSSKNFVFEIHMKIIWFANMKNMKIIWSWAAVH